MKLQWSETARNDLISIRNFIAEDNAAAAKNWIDLLRTKARDIASSRFFPQRERKQGSIPRMGQTIARRRNRFLVERVI